MLHNKIENNFYLQILLYQDLMYAIAPSVGSYARNDQEYKILYRFKFAQILDLTE